MKSHSAFVWPAIVMLAAFALLAFQPTPPPSPTPLIQSITERPSIYEAIPPESILLIVSCATSVIGTIVTGTVGIFVLFWTRRVKSAADIKDIKVYQEESDARYKEELKQLEVKRAEGEIERGLLVTKVASQASEAVGKAFSAEEASKISAQAAKDSAEFAAASAKALSDNRAETAAIRKELEELKISSQTASDAKDGEISALKKQVEGLQKEIENLKQQQAVTREDAEKKALRDKEESDRKDRIIEDQRKEIRELHEQIRVLSLAAPSNAQAQAEVIHKVQIAQPKDSPVPVTETGGKPE